MHSSHPPSIIRQAAAAAAVAASHFISVLLLDLPSIHFWFRFAAKSMERYSRESRDVENGCRHVDVNAIEITRVVDALQHPSNHFPAMLLLLLLVCIEISIELPEPYHRHLHRCCTPSLCLCVFFCYDATGNRKYFFFDSHVETIEAEEEEEGEEDEVATLHRERPLNAAPTVVGEETWSRKAGPASILHCIPVQRVQCILMQIVCTNAAIFAAMARTMYAGAYRARLLTYKYCYFITGADFAHLAAVASALMMMKMMMIIRTLYREFVIVSAPERLLSCVDS